ncbi:hypothetical protein CTI12_AA041310 [Artemisia annua]|uniref:Uncharacterized protein n=1 Tax=Artemisia annua TaxID=35608 RepID=A0A2U1QDT1_ARTAN|nr:hypothetical protein CTI12_AA041310 [Artemisia annua]
MESDKVVTISPAHPQWGAYFSMMFCMIAIFNSLLQLVIRMLLPDPVPPPPAILIITPIASFALVALVTGILIFQHLFFQTCLQWPKLLVLCASLVYDVVGTAIVLKRFISDNFQHH